MTTTTTTDRLDLAQIERAAPEERRRLGNLAMGALFRMMSRPDESGDIERYYQCRAIIMALQETP